MIPELAVSILACARIGFIHSVVLQDFQSHRRRMTVHAKWLSPDGGFAAIKPLI
jgi:acyl-coenzyme A synthetase/AMP-(fatty) acid ligase